MNTINEDDKAPIKNTIIDIVHKSIVEAQHIAGDTATDEAQDKTAQATKPEKLPDEK